MTSPVVGPGTHILVYGASGAIGSAGVQLAKDRGAEVTAAVEARHLDLARSLGADHVVDCASAELARLGRRFDVVYDAVGKMPISQWRRLLKPDGIFTTTDMGPWSQSLLAWLGARIVRSKGVVIRCRTVNGTSVPHRASRPDGGGKLSRDHRSHLSSRPNCRCLSRTSIDVRQNELWGRRNVPFRRYFSSSTVHCEARTTGAKKVTIGVA